ncbi:MAG: hypothetical protein Fur0042_27730 [Cyanophyceae cyanobacterium]
MAHQASPLRRPLIQTVEAFGLAVAAARSRHGLRSLAGPAERGRSGAARRPKGANRGGPRPAIARKALPKGSVAWLPWAGGGLAFLLLDWKLTVAIALGGATSTALSRLGAQDWQNLEGRAARSRDRWLRGANGKLLLTVGGGGILASTLYLSTAIWSESHSGWLATESLLQGVGITVALALLLRQWYQDGNSRQEERFARWIDDLRHPDPVAQLAAIRQIGRLVTRDRLDADCRAIAADCLSLLLTGQTPLAAPVRRAALETLTHLEPSRRARAHHRPARPAAPAPAPAALTPLPPRPPRSGQSPHPSAPPDPE